MDLTLTSAQQHAAFSAMRVMSSPLLYDSEPEWGADLVAHTRDLFGAAICSFHNPRGNDISFLGSGLSDEEIAIYMDFEPMLRETGLFARLGQLRVATREQAYGPHYESILRSDYNQEFLRSVGSGESLTLAVPLVPEPYRQQDLVQLMFNRAYGESPFDERAVCLARLLYPSFEAGVRLIEQDARHRRDRRSLLDRTGGSCAVFTGTGFLIHTTNELDEILERDSRRDELMHCVRALAGTLSTGLLERCDGSPPPSDTRIENRFDGARGRYSIAATPVNKGRGSTEILVSVSHPKQPGSPSDETLRDRFGLTPQEVRAARLLAERRTNREIADALAISIHTARHHVQHALEKLDVSRREVESVLAV